MNTEKEKVLEDNLDKAAEVVKSGIYIETLVDKATNNQFLFIKWPNGDFQIVTNENQTIKWTPILTLRVKKFLNEHYSI